MDIIETVIVNLTSLAALKPFGIVNEAGQKSITAIL